MGVFARIMEGLASEAAERKTIMIDATYLKAHRTASSLRAKKGARTGHRAHERGAEHQEFHAIADAKGRPLKFFMTAGDPLGDASIACRATGQRLHRCCGPAGPHAEGRVTSGRPRV